MKRLLIPLVLCLAACGPTTGAISSAGTIAAGAADVVGVPPPIAIADKTTLDERGLLRLERLYRAMRSTIELGVTTGVIRGGFALTLAKLDSFAFGKLEVARAAYDTGNAESYTAALRIAEAAVAAMLGDSK